MTLFRAFAAVAGSVVICTAAGMGLGVALGNLAPDFYRATLPRSPIPNPDPVQIGLGFGLNAGAFSGIAIGLLVVAIVTYYELRSAELKRPLLPDSAQGSATSPERHPAAFRDPAVRKSESGVYGLERDAPSE